MNKEIESFLFLNSDVKYRDFSKKIIETKYEILGVRTPVLRDIAKKNKGNEIEFLENNNSNYYEMIMLEGFFLGNLKDVDLVIKYLDSYVNKIDNWALCDQMVASLKIIKKNKGVFYKLIRKYLKSIDEYRVRVGLVMLLDYYVEEEYLDEIFDIASNLKRKEYYINMALAWLLSICYIKYPERTFSYLKTCNLDKFTYNKTISKIRDSYRVSQEDKQILKNMRKK